MFNRDVFLSTISMHMEKQKVEIGRGKEPLVCFVHFKSCCHFPFCTAVLIPLKAETPLKYMTDTNNGDAFRFHSTRQKVGYSIRRT